MNNTQWFNEQTKEWEDIYLDENGFPLTPQRKKILEGIDLKAIKISEKARQKEEEILAERPKGRFWIYDADLGEWVKNVPPPPSPAPIQIWPSWTEGKDGLWYSPIPYPSKDPLEYLWDELEQEWVDAKIVREKWQNQQK